VPWPLPAFSLKIQYPFTFECAATRCAACGLGRWRCSHFSNSALTAQPQAPHFFYALPSSQKPERERQSLDLKKVKRGVDPMLPVLMTRIIMVPCLYLYRIECTPLRSEARCNVGSRSTSQKDGTCLLLKRPLPS
jgi:hypothetical protein